MKALSSSDRNNLSENRPFQEGHRILNRILLKSDHFELRLKIYRVVGLKN